MLKRSISLLLAGTSFAFANTPSTPASLPTLTITGNTIMNAYVAHNSTTIPDGKRDFHLANDASDLYFTIKGRTSNGLEYGYKIDIQSQSGGSPVFNQNYVEFNSKLGTVQVGNLGGPSKTMIEDGGSILGATGGFDGGYHNIALLPAFVLRGNNNVGDPGNATKITYYTPTYQGFRLGFSFTPDTSKSGDDGADKARNSNHNAPGNRAFLPNKKLYPFDLNNFTVGLSYKKEVNNWGVTLSGVYIGGDAWYPVLSDDEKTSPAKRTKARRTSAYQLGTVITYKRANNHLVEVGGGYLNNGKSRLETGFGTIVANNAPLKFYVNKGANTGSPIGFGNLFQGNSGQAWNAAFGYTMGIYKVSFGYQGTERKTDATSKTRSNVYSIATDITPVGGLKFFVEANYLKARTNDAAMNTAGTLASYSSGTPQRDFNNLQFKTNEAVVGIIGTKISF